MAITLPSTNASPSSQDNQDTSQDIRAELRGQGLRYVTDQSPGIERRKRGRTFVYYYQDARVSDDKALARIKALVIPPAWTKVWICPDPRGYLQAIGQDAKGRKQYRYHPDWTRLRGERKFARMIEFGRALPGLRAIVERDLSLPGLGHRKVTALAVNLLDKTMIRVGNDEYARQNRSYGLTTLRDKHVRDDGKQGLKLEFVGKKGIRQQIAIEDRRLTRLIRQCRDLPGYELFQYLDDAGKRRRIDSEDVNVYIREHTGGAFTAKDFRTWGGSAAAVRAIVETEWPEGEAEIARTSLSIIRQVAKQLGNTAAVCRSYYIHPEVLGSVAGGRIQEVKRNTPLDHPDIPTGLNEDERLLMALLLTARAEGKVEGSDCDRPSKTLKKTPSRIEGKTATVNAA